MDPKEKKVKEEELNVEETLNNAEEQPQVPEHRFFHTNEHRSSLVALVSGWPMIFYI